MGIVKILVSLLMTYFIAGFGIFYMISTGTAIPMWDSIGEIVELIFSPVGLVFNMVAPTLGVAPVNAPVPFMP